MNIENQFLRLRTRGIQMLKLRTILGVSTREIIELERRLGCSAFFARLDVFRSQEVPLMEKLARTWVQYDKYSRIFIKMSRSGKYRDMPSEEFMSYKRAQTLFKKIEELTDIILEGMGRIFLIEKEYGKFSLLGNRFYLLRSLPILPVLSVYTAFSDYNFAKMKIAMHLLRTSHEPQTQFVLEKKIKLPAVPNA
jgi:hypothetical protein